MVFPGDHSATSLIPRLGGWHSGEGIIVLSPFESRADTASISGLFSPRLCVVVLFGCAVPDVLPHGHPSDPHSSMELTYNPYTH